MFIWPFIVLVRCRRVVRVWRFSKTTDIHENLLRERARSNNSWQMVVVGTRLSFWSCDVDRGTRFAAFRDTNRPKRYDLPRFLEQLNVRHTSTVRLTSSTDLPRPSESVLNTGSSISISQRLTSLGRIFTELNAPNLMSIRCSWISSVVLKIAKRAQINVSGLFENTVLKFDFNLK